MRPRALDSLVAALVAATPTAALGQAAAPARAPAPLTDAELAQITGKFVLPNGVQIALSVTSDTIVDGQVVLRTVLTVDRTSTLQVFGRDGSAPTPELAQAAARPTGVTVSLDRTSGLQTVTPTYAAAPAVSVGAAAPAAPSAGLVALPLVPGAPGVATADGVVSLATVRGGQEVSLAGDRLAVANIVGSTVATALANTANNRTLGSVTNVQIDLRNAAPYQTASAAMRVETMALDAVSRGMMR